MDRGDDRALARVRQIAQQLTERRRRNTVQSRSGLVKKQQARTRQELHGHANTLAFTTANALLEAITNDDVAAVIQAQLANHVFDALLLFRGQHRRRQTQFGRVVQRLLDRQAAIEQIVL
jgi:hypothetical protein